MLVPVLQLLVAIPFLGLLFYFWRRITGESPAIRALVTAGFLVRAFTGQILFWISYLGLPIGKHLQLGDGFWFFGLDSQYYQTEALRLSGAGLTAIATASKTLPAVVFIQTLAGLTILLGSSVGVGLFFNLVCYLASCRIVLSCSSQRESRAVLFAIGALSLSPSGILWGLQPLKDTLFLFLIIAFVGSCMAWQRAWSSGSLPSAILAGSFAVAILYAAAGVRWYVALAELVAFLAFLTVVAIQTQRKLASFSVGLIFLQIGSLAFLSAGGPYVPEKIQRTLSPATFVSSVAGMPLFLLTSIEGARRGFEGSGGSTMIRQAKNVEPIALSGFRASVSEPAKAAPGIAPRIVPTPIPTAQPTAIPHLVAERGAVPAVVGVTDAKTVSIPIPTVRLIAASHLVAERPAVPVVAAMMKIAAPIAIPRDLIKVSESSVPPGRVERLLTGLAATAIPRSVTQRLGVIDIQGGRGLWLFADLDTLAFDLVMLLALIQVCQLRPRQAFSNPALWMLTILLVLIGGPLLYTCTNFGTLFRLRGILYAVVALMPLSLSTSPQTLRTPQTPVTTFPNSLPAA